MVWIVEIENHRVLHAVLYCKYTIFQSHRYYKISERRWLMVLRLLEQHQIAGVFTLKISQYRPEHVCQQNSKYLHIV